MTYRPHPLSRKQLNSYVHMHDLQYLLNNVSRNNSVQCSTWGRAESAILRADQKDRGLLRLRPDEVLQNGTATRHIIIIYIKHIWSSYADPKLFVFSLYTPCLGTSCQLVIATVLCFSQVHVSSESMIPDHCRAYALSYPQDDDYIKKCDHEHNVRCDRCKILPTVL